jgi:ethylbenzene dioxygenase subunit beta
MIAADKDERLAARRGRQLKLLGLAGRGVPVSTSELAQISSALNREARLLDMGLFRDWYEWLSDDLIYWVPVRENRYRRDKAPELFPGCASLFDDNKLDIDLRLKRLESGMAWTEDPATRAVMQVTNIEAFVSGEPDLVEVHSCVALYRHRAEHDDSLLIGRRKDLLLRCGDELRLQGRLVLLAQSVLLAKNISTFF